MTILLDKELKTQQTVKFLENVLHASTDGILLTDVSQNIIFANEAFCDIIGHKKEQILETNIFTWLEQFSGDAIDSWVKLETSVNKQGKVRNIMFQKTIKDSIKYSSVNASLLERVDEEERGYIISIWRDITERKMVELKLKESEEKYRQLVENIPDAIYSTLPDETGTTTFMSNKWFAWSGFAPEDFYKDPKAWEKSIHPDDRDSTLKKFIEMCKQEKEYILEYRVLHKETGESSFLKDHGVPIYDHKGNISRYDGIVTDISDQKEVEKRLKESEMALRKSQQELKLKNQISNVFLTVPDEKMFGEVLSIILKTLKSEFGIFGYLDENENLVEPSLTEDVWEKCAIEDKIKVFPKKLWSKNIYGRVINEKNSLFVEYVY